MTLKLGFLIAVFSSSFSATAVTLQAFPTPQDPPLPISATPTPVPCNQIVDQLVSYQTMANQHSSSLTGFLSQVSGLIGGWYTTLSPLEGTTQNLSVGTFQPLQDGSDKISNLTGMANDNNTLLSGQLDNLIGSLRACTISTPAVK